jgi:hypothetical protein
MPSLMPDGELRHDKVFDTEKADVAPGGEYPFDTDCTVVQDESRGDTENQVVRYRGLT